MKEDSQLWQAFVKRSEHTNGELRKRHHILSKEASGSLQRGCSLSPIETVYGGLVPWYVYSCLQVLTKA
jgi:hypothetical protein